MQAQDAPVLDHNIVRLQDPDFYAGNPFPVYKRMRNEAPVFWYEPLKFWVLTKQEDIRKVSTGKEYTSGKGLIINDIINNNVVANLFPEGATIMSMMDPPEHTGIRKLLNPSFGMAMIKRLEPRVREIACNILDNIPDGETIDWVETLSVPLPVMMICQLLGLRELRVEDFKDWSDQFISVGKAASKEELAQYAESLGAMQQFFREELEAQRTDPQGGVIAELLALELEGGGKLDEQTLIQFCQLFLVTGNETTRNALSAQMHLLIDHPDQYRILQEDPKYCDTASDETVRYFTPTLGFFRVPIEDVEIRGQQIKAGEPVYMLYHAANRDEDIYENPEEYDVTRPKNPGHLGFGAGFHFCIGALLARLELRVTFEEVVRRFSKLELAGEPVRVDSILNSAYDKLPVKLTRI